MEHIGIKDTYFYRHSSILKKEGYNNLKFCYDVNKFRSKVVAISIRVHVTPNHSTIN